jgi:antitoxin component YwqK of YwqJK toxin-antitoxin module
MKKILILIIVALSFFCQGQTDNYQDIDFNDIVEIKGQIYLKADTTLATGRVIRYSRKKEAKRYIIVRKGNPDNSGWIYFKDKHEIPKESVIGDLVSLAAVTTAAVMVISGKDINMPLPVNNINNTNNKLLGNQVSDYLDYNKEIGKKLYKEASERNEITKRLKLNKNSKITEKPIDGYYQKYNEEDQLEIKGNYINGKKNGIWKKYYSTGKIKSIGVYNNDVKVGLWEEYYENSQLKRKAIYNKGFKDGLWVEYHSNSQILTKGHYKDGRLTGEWKYYDEDGKLLLTEDYED